MKRGFWREHKKIWRTAVCLMLAVLIAGTGLFTYRNSVSGDIPELVTFTDPEGVTAQEDEVPLASGTKTTKKVTTKKTTKKTKMKKKAKKTATTTKKTTKKTTKTKTSSTQKVKTNTKVVTTIKTSTKKSSKIKTIRTTVVTTVTTTTTALKAASSTAAQTTAAAATGTQTYKVRSVASACDARVLNAYEKMGFTVVVNPTVAYSGRFDAAEQNITLKQLNSTVYHELGHFVEFVGGTSSVKQAITTAYNQEKSKYTAYNKTYVLQSSSEYFAESFKNYCENPSALKSSRPLTYNAIVQALNNITDTRVNTIIKVYSAVWK